MLITSYVHKFVIEIKMNRTMVLYKIGDFDADERNNIEGMSVYTQASSEEIGTVINALVDDQGKFRYLIVNIGFWVFGKKVLLPISRGRIDFYNDCVYVTMTKREAEDLPEYEEGMTLDVNYEERLRRSFLLASLGATAKAIASAAPIYDRGTYNYTQDTDLYK
ncbi:hypothetical protein RIVM261_056840 [Rivularia sp. IAM M-261]|nr:hypothetical protein RIVM261_056840 [Rivularia sp. IAM M-261]